MAARDPVSLGEATRVWARIALLSFGGPAGQIALMHRILVEEKRWIGEQRFLHALNFCMLLPGPEAQQLATYVGWLLHRTRGGLIAGTLFVLPGLIAIMALSWIYVLYGRMAPVAALFFGLKAAVVAIVFQAVVRIGSRSLRRTPQQAVAAAAFAAIFFFDAPFPLIVAIAAAAGFLMASMGSRSFDHIDGDDVAPAYADEDSALGAELSEHARSGRGRSVAISSLLLLMWLAPVGALALAAGADNIFAQIASFFARMAVVSFGGAYAVLTYVAQAAVDAYGWLSPTEMLDGLGLAETTPGPLIMVTQFVGFLGAYRNPGSLPPLLAGTIGGLLTTWVTFVPCFVWIFLGAPFVERLRTNRALAAALAGVTAAVVGVILNLALWFALHFMFAEVDDASLGPISLERPRLDSLDMLALILSIGALVATFRFRVGVVGLLAGAAAAGLVLRGLLGL
jgi:chromate transporter